MPTQQEFVGILAQEVPQIAPYMVGKFTYQDTIGKQEEYLDYDATSLTYILVNALVEMEAEEAIKDNNKAHEQLTRQSTLQIAKLSEDAQFLSQVRELTRFVITI